MNPPQTEQNDTRSIISVSELNRRGKQLLESHFAQLWVEGEISNFACPSSGHWYFTLKDDKAQVRCAMFKSRNQRLRIRPKNGDQIIARARASLYEGRGEFQLIVEFVEDSGDGALLRAFNELKQKLTAEGLFDTCYKQALPELPLHIGVITSPSGAAVHDIINVLGRRFASTKITVFPATVQGECAAQEISHMISRANELSSQLDPPLDLLLVGRGGGSMEDLQAFNDEQVARALFDSSLPTVSAVGHETDITIADFVADVRAATPSAAAELISPDQMEWQQTLQAYENYFHTAASNKLTYYCQQLLSLSKRLRHPGSRLREQAQRLDDVELHLKNAITRLVMIKREEVSTLHHKLAIYSPNSQIAAAKLEAQQLSFRLNNSLQHLLEKSKNQLINCSQRLETVSPLATLNRGYAIVQNQKQEIVRDYLQVNSGEQIKAKLANGELLCTVDSSKPSSQS